MVIFKTHADNSHIFAHLGISSRKKETVHLKICVAWTGQGTFQSLPLFLLHGLLPHSHILHVFLQTIQRGIWLDANPIVMVLGVSSS